MGPMKPAPPDWPRLGAAMFYDDPRRAIDWLCKSFGFFSSRFQFFRFSLSGFFKGFLTFDFSKSGCLFAGSFQILSLFFSGFF